ncbi:hypothetical protein M3N64_13640 [Sporolactobacillus sp. CPB3-1]|uniref:FeoB-associated Cys-rich membrane protein n=1 Tax=Sporolactobacillus mangiferae TaxID=2940498 RepID=A0ABT0ME57_9BACL|nr:hypothetical protein [Sporolactobacillus mangiferae]MCL1632963.1 hypothetical protein [Sporolactobacillus mangiferae]
MNSPTLVIFIVLLFLLMLALRHVFKNKGSCTDCGLSGSCPIQELRQTAICRSGEIAEIPKLQGTELRAMIRK